MTNSYSCTHRFGTTLATATMLPLVPLSRAWYIMPATPVSTLKSSGTRASTSLTWAMLPLESLRPTMLSWRARMATVGAARSAPNTAGWLYSSTGIGLASATRS